MIVQPNKINPICVLLCSEIHSNIFINSVFWADNKAPDNFFITHCIIFYSQTIYFKLELSKIPQECISVELFYRMHFIFMNIFSNSLFMLGYCINKCRNKKIIIKLKLKGFKSLTIRLMLYHFMIYMFYYLRLNELFDE